MFQVPWAVDIHCSCGACNSVVLSSVRSSVIDNLNKWSRCSGLIIGGGGGGGGGGGELHFKQRMGEIYGSILRITKLKG